MTTGSDDVVARVSKIVRETVHLPDPGASVGENTPLLGEGIGVDSVEILKLVAALEEEFDLEIDDEALTLEMFATVGSVARLVRDR